MESDVLYHGTPLSNLVPILDQGLKAGCFFTNKESYAAAFCRLGRLFDPSSKECVVFSIDRSQLNPEHLHVSNDHAPEFYPDDLESWHYTDTISPDLIVNVSHFEFPDQED